MKPAKVPFSVHQCLLGLVGEGFTELHFSPAVLSVPYLTYSLQFSPNSYLLSQGEKTQILGSNSELTEPGSEHRPRTQLQECFKLLSF